MIAWEESPRQFKMSKQLDEGKFGEDLARKFLNDPLNKWGQGDSIADLYAKSGATVCRVSSTQDLLTFLQSAGTTRHF